MKKIDCIISTIFAVIIMCLININYLYAKEIGVKGFYLGMDGNEACALLEKQCTDKSFKKTDGDFEEYVSLLNGMKYIKYSKCSTENITIYINKNNKVEHMEFELSAFNASNLNSEQFSRRVLQLSFVKDLYLMKNITVYPERILDVGFSGKKTITDYGYYYDNMDEGYSVISSDLGLFIKKIKTNINFDESCTDTDFN